MMTAQTLRAEKHPLHSTILAVTIGILPAHAVAQHAAELTLGHFVTDLDIVGMHALELHHLVNPHTSASVRDPNAVWPDRC